MFFKKYTSLIRRSIFFKCRLGSIVHQITHLMGVTMIGQKQFVGQPRQSSYLSLHPLQMSDVLILAWVVDEKFNPTIIAKAKNMLTIILFFISSLLIFSCLYLKGMT